MILNKILLSGDVPVEDLNDSFFCRDNSAKNTHQSSVGRPGDVASRSSFGTTSEHRTTKIGFRS